MRVRTPPRIAASTALALLVVGLLVARSSAQPVIPEALPAIPDLAFPESEAALTADVAAANGATNADPAAARHALEAHAWGLWTALTSFSRQTYERQTLRVFETWKSLDELLPPPDGEPAAASAFDVDSGSELRVSPRRLTALRFTAREPIVGEPDDPDLAADRITGTVKINPAAAAHIVAKRLLSVSTLKALLAAGASDIPTFPSDALIVKPIYRVAAHASLVAGRYFLLPVWTGPPAIPQSWGPDRWPAAIWVDLAGEGSGAGAVDAAPQMDGSSRTDSTTYPVSDFIHHRLSATDAAALNDAVPGSGARAGDTALLVAMHVAGRELPRWTWQTFWWTPDPEQLPPPSSSDAASARPPQLQGAARHYAMALAYAMTTADGTPAAATNSAPVLYAYNPYIEARFGPADLPDSRPGFGPDGQPAANNVGAQTNCLSCHAQATYHDPDLATAPRFTGARFVDLTDASFAGALPTEFLWILSRHAR